MSHDSTSLNPPAPGFAGFMTVCCCIISLIFVGLAGISFFVNVPVPESWYKEIPAQKAPPPPGAPLASGPSATAVKLTLNASQIGLEFVEKELYANAGADVEVTLANQSPLAHNVIFCNEKLVDEANLNSPSNKGFQALLAAATAMTTDPEGVQKQYIPESPYILAHSSLVTLGQSEVIRFKAPTEPGVYPYLCSYIGHTFIMQGKLIVK